MTLSIPSGYVNRDTIIDYQYMCSEGSMQSHKFVLNTGWKTEIFQRAHSQYSERDRKHQREAKSIREQGWRRLKQITNNKFSLTFSVIASHDIRNKYKYKSVIK